MKDKDGTFLVVDLKNSTGIAVAIVPHFWFSSSSCRYPPLNRKGNRSVTSREIPEEDWFNYPAVCRGTHVSYTEARRKLAVAEVLSDINIPSDAEGVNLGRGKRTKRPRVTYSPGDASEGEDESSTLSRAPPIPPNLWRHQSPSFLPTNLLSNGSFVSNNNTAYNSSTEHGPSVGYCHTGSPTHGCISLSGNSLPEHGPSTQYADPGSSNSYSNFGQSRNPSTGNSPSVRYGYPGSSGSFGYLGPSVNTQTDHVMSEGHELQYGNLGSSTSFSHPRLSPSIVRSQSAASIDRPGSSFSVDRPGSPALVAHPGSSASIVRPGLSASIVPPESSASIDRPGSSGSIGRPGSSISQVDSGFSGEHSPPFATNGSYGHHSQPEYFRHLSQFEHHVLPSPSFFRGHPLERRSSTSERSDTSAISRSVELTANALPARALLSI